MTTKLGKSLAHGLPFSSFLTDTFGRQHNYLRISLTEKCNLRCVYCMPENGVRLQPSSEMLSTSEVITLSRLFVSEGVKKIRYTGGEPTVRKDLLHIVRTTGEMGVPEICVTSNGLTLHRSLEELQRAGLTGVNLSLDTLEPGMFELITRRKGLSAVLKSLETSLALGIKTKLNVVVLPQNFGEVHNFVELTKDKNFEVRFIEYMPFDGNRWSREKLVTYQQLKTHIQKKYNLVPLPHSDTAKVFHIPGHRGTVGFITSMTHNFCAGCNRLRITADGNLKVCLFDNKEVSLRDLMRRGAGEAELLGIIQAAVRNKKKEHGDMEDIKREGGRPMILIGG